MNADTDSWDNEGGQLGTAEGGHMSSSSGRVLRVPGAALPYMVILTRPDLVDLCRSFRTMREAEAFVQKHSRPGSGAFDIVRSGGGRDVSAAARAHHR